MPKFKNKKTGVVVEESLNFYIDKLRKNPNFVEIEENTSKETPKKNKEIKEDVVNTPQ